MPRRMTDYIYAYGLKAGLPYGLLRKMADGWDRAGNLRDSAKRRRAGGRLLADSEWQGFLPRDKAYRAFGKGEIPGLDRLVEISRDILARHKREGNHGIDLGKPNPFEMHLTADEFRENPEILKIALSRPLIDIVTDYFGAVPRLAYADLWVTPRYAPDDTPFNSQLFHLDKPHFGLATLFLNVQDVGPDNGPFVMLPGDISKDICRRTNYPRCYYLSDGRLTNEQVTEAAGGEPLIELTGPAGAGAFVDPTECLHYGSRCSKGERVVFVLRYVPGFRTWDSYMRNFVTRPDGDPELVELLLDGAPSLAHPSLAH